MYNVVLASMLLAGGEATTWHNCRGYCHGSVSYPGYYQGGCHGGCHARCHGRCHGGCNGGCNGGGCCGGGYMAPEKQAPMPAQAPAK